ncbi:RagB/SusD family nutrient uptake outer membrane protein [Aquimarina sp. Aq78]|uniref:RagB/SusD family nutrient uptake outer membrane protein n=1 Tax=Aquimarina sp. Aq78 TaxID=1191889 RepID=UPI000D0F3355|nr:RagB/SusD family nutrient uptake outer membrane protein [Aquimarina sp. Aq78]
MKKKIVYLVCSALFIASISSCSNDDLEPTLLQNQNLEGNISTIEDLSNLLNGTYSWMTQSTYYGRDIIVYGEARSDNAYSTGKSGRFISVSDMNMLESDGYALNTWSVIYTAISTANIAINVEGVEGDEDQINHTKGQAYVIRALGHFDLLRLYGQQHVDNGGLSALGVPYIDKFKDDGDLLPSRKTVGEVKNLILADLDKASSLMSETLNGTSTYITTYAANAVKARVALYFEEYGIAKDAAKAVIDSGQFTILDSASYVESWSKDNEPNSIFELAYDKDDNQGINGLANIYRFGYGDIVAYDDFTSIFDAGDIRRTTSMIDIDGDKLRNIGKYPSQSFDDNISLIRYEEIILIYAEALLETGATGDALSWLNMIPDNRDANLYTEATKENILLERRKELCFEGFRFDDLARTKQDIPKLNVVSQGPVYGSYNYAFPIPLAELNANSNMIPNKGY